MPKSAVTTRTTAVCISVNARIATAPRTTRTITGDTSQSNAADAPTIADDRTAINARVSSRGRCRDKALVSTNAKKVNAFNSREANVDGRSVVAKSIAHAKQIVHANATRRRHHDADPCTGARRARAAMMTAIPKTNANAMRAE